MLKKKTSLIILLLVTGAVLFFFFVNQSEKPDLKGKLSYKTYAADSGWGYRIFAGDTNLLIQQDVIPGLPGSKGFDSESKAERTAKFVIYKIEKGVFPPTVSPGELDSLGVL